MKHVLIVSHQQGFESDPVIDALRERDVAVLRFNQDDAEFISSMSASIDVDFDIHFQCDGKTLSGNDVAVGWFQQPPPYCGQPMNETECLQRVTIDTMIYAALQSLECPWFNRFDNVMRAGNKLLQLQAARAVRLPLMPTLPASPLPVLIAYSSCPRCRADT